MTKDLLAEIVARAVVVCALACALGCDGSHGGASTIGEPAAPVASASLDRLARDTGVTWTAFGQGPYGYPADVHADGEPTRAESVDGEPSRRALALLESYGALIGVHDARDALVIREETRPVPLRRTVDGWRMPHAIPDAEITSVIFGQVERGVPVEGASVHVTFLEGRPVSFGGTFVPDLGDASVDPAYLPAEVIARACADFSAHHAEANDALPEVTTTRLSLRVDGPASPRAARLVYEVFVRYGATVGVGEPSFPHDGVLYDFDARAGSLLGSRDADIH